MNWRDFSKRQKNVTLDGVVDIPVEVAFTDIGEGDPVVMLHGIPTWSYLYHDVIDRLASHYRVIAPDFIGHGFSDRRDRFDRSLTVQANMVIQLLRHLDLERASVVGHDTGGGVGLILGIERPDLVDRLVLCNAVAYDSWPISDMVTLGDPTWEKKTPDQLQEFLYEGFKEGLHNPERLTDEFKEGLMAPYLDRTGQISLIRNASALNTNHTTMLVDRHAEIRAPTLLLWGVHDPWQPLNDAERLESEIPGARLRRLEGGGHWTQQDVPEAFTAELFEFLGSK